MENLFERVLDEDEKLIKVYKPNKCKFLFSNILLMSLVLLVFASIGVLAVLFPEEGVASEPIYVLIPIGIYVFLLGLYIVFLAIYYKNVVYAYTNKRIIIRSGIFGVDFKSLDMAMIGAVNVYVSLIDKILKKDTGSLTFGSMASPMGAQAGSIYKFSNIVMPYETCKEIKSAIDKFKNTQKEDRK